jgi:hypothetical protein
VTSIEPGAYSTDWSGPSGAFSERLPAYGSYFEQVMEARRKRIGTPGRPEATRAAILEVVDAESPPRRIFFGDGPLATATADYESRLATWREWEPVSIAAQG